MQRRAATELSRAAGAPGGACGVATYLAYHDAERVALIEPVEGEALVAAKLKSRPVTPPSTTTWPPAPA